LPRIEEIGPIVADLRDTVRLSRSRRRRSELDRTDESRYLPNLAQLPDSGDRPMTAVRWLTTITVLIGMLPAPAHGEDIARQGQQALEKEEYDKAIAAFTTAIETNPKDAASYRGRGDAYRKLDKLDRALAEQLPIALNRRVWKRRSRIGWRPPL
jgi:tetratricopeptide (TPR) repeat protein